MTKFELLQKMDVKQAAKYLCYLHVDCDKCPQYYRCHKDHNGWLAYLSRESTNGDRCAAGMEIEIEKQDKPGFLF